MRLGPTRLSCGFLDSSGSRSREIVRFRPDLKTLSRASPPFRTAPGVFADAMTCLEASIALRGVLRAAWRWKPSGSCGKGRQHFSSIEARSPRETRRYNRDEANCGARVRSHHAESEHPSTSRDPRVCESLLHTSSTLSRNGMTPTQIVEELPDLEEEDIRQALAYAAALAQDEVHPIRA